ncbi:MAG: SRPBCC domain-containing protein [Chloroflexi bacterium]|nr:SRPBCC domain-containing protein [Chloroflexota bacterium]
MPESIRVSAVLPATPQRIYEAWLDSRQHGSFTGGAAEIDPTVGGVFTTWDGYIRGVTEALEPYRRILQAWRTTDFPEDAPDSRLEVLLEPSARGTRITLVHTGIPDGQGADYRQGWKDHYFAPMKAYLAKGEGPFQ